MPYIAPIPYEDVVPCPAAIDYLVRVVTNEWDKNPYEHLGIAAPVWSDERENVLGQISKGAQQLGVMESWTDEEIAAKRMTRNEVIVTKPDGSEQAYVSLRVAFRQLHLPDNKHIRFRQKLKAAPAGRAVPFDWNGKTYTFKLGAVNMGGGTAFAAAASM